MDHLPSLTPKKIIKILGRVGFVIDYYQGSHAYLEHKGRGLRACVPVHNKDLSRGFLKSILRQAQISEEEFRKLL